MNTMTDIEARNRRICATYKSHRNPSKNSRHRSHKSDALMQTAKLWKMPIREIRLIIEAGEAAKLGVDARTYSIEKAVERSEKTTEWQKERDAHIARCAKLGLDENANPLVMDRFLTFLQA